MIAATMAAMMKRIAALPLSRCPSVRLPCYHCFLVRSAVSVALLLLVLSGASCNRQKAAVRYARDLVQAGEFERALELLNRFDQHGNAPELNALRGRVLSLVPSTMVDGMFLMNSTVDELDDPELRRDLFVFFVDTDQLSRAGQLVSGERLGPDRFFRQDNVILRSAYKCLESPDIEKARRIRQLATEKKDEAQAVAARDSADTLALLCLGRSLKRLGAEADVSWVLDAKKSDALIGRSPAKALLTETAKAFLDIYRNGGARGRCEAAARIFVLSGPEIPVREECLKHFPESLLLRRVWPVSLAGLDMERSGPMLFDDRPFFPVYVPRPELEVEENESLTPEPGQGTGGLPSAPP